MKLSDAIALGRTLCKPIALYRNDGVGGACALGMADLAFGNIHWQNSPQFAWTGKRVAQPPPCGCAGWQGSLTLQIAHLNNFHVFGGDKTWTLDQLIDWVRSVEPVGPEQESEPVIERITVQPRQVKNLEPLNDWETGQDKELERAEQNELEMRAGLIR